MAKQIDAQTLETWVLKRWHIFRVGLDTKLWIDYDIPNGSDLASDIIADAISRGEKS